MEISFQIICNIREKKVQLQLFMFVFHIKCSSLFLLCCEKKQSNYSTNSNYANTLHWLCMNVASFKKSYRAFKLSTMNIFFYAGEHNIKITLVLFEEFATHFWWFNINRIVFINL